MFKKTLTSLILTLVAFGGFFGVNTHNESGKIVLSGINQTYAECIRDKDGKTISCDNYNTTNQNADMQKMLNGLVAGINIILSILTIIVSPAIMLASWLMTPDWTAGDIFGIRPVLHDLWITVSNITYFIYAILLIVIALATIFNSEHYGYKAMLPKLALGIILVPLTWWMVQWTISLATYITAASISLPAESIKKFSAEGSWWNTYSIPKTIVYKNESNLAGGEYDLTSKTGSVADYCGFDQDKKGNPDICTSPELITKDSAGLFSPLLIYSFAVFKIQNVKLIDTNPLYALKSIIDIVHQGIVGAVMFIIYGILVLGLIFMLMMRAMKLWFYAIFSPLFTIKFILGDKAFGDGDKDGSFNITEFLGLAFVPAVVSLALSFGLVIIAALHSPLGTGGGSNPDNSCTGNTCTIRMMGNDKTKITSKVSDDQKTTETTIQIGEFKYTFYGSVQGGEKVVPGISSALSATGNLFGTIIIDIIALVFIWIAFMAGKGISKAASAAIEPFEAMGKKIGDLGMKLPQYAPIPGTGGVSIAGANKIVQSAASDFETRAQTKAYDSPLAKAFGVDNDSKKVIGEQQKLQQALNDGKIDNINTLRSLQESTQKIIAVHGLSSREGREALENMAKILENSGRKYSGELVDNAGNLKDGGNWVLTGDLDSTTRTKGTSDADRIKWKNKQKDLNGTGSTKTVGFNTTQFQNGNFSFNFNGGPQVNLDKKLGSDMSADEIAKAINQYKNDFKDEHRATEQDILKLFQGTGRTGDLKKLAKDVFGKLDSKVTKKADESPSAGTGEGT